MLYVISHMLYVKCHVEDYRMTYNLLIHKANPQPTVSRPIVIIVFTHVVRPSPLFTTKHISSEITNDTCLVSSEFKMV